MSTNTAIEWTESTWNPVTGCTKISEGCAHCYAERMARRLQAMGQKNYVNGFNVAQHPHALNLPLNWKKPQTIFVNSMSDLFYKDIPISFIRQVFDIMEQAYWHRFQILTKRANRLSELTPLLNWPHNVWIGVTVEKVSYIRRIDYLRHVPASVRFLSLEPLLGPLPKLNLSNIDWVIVGGESGPGARPMKKNGCLIFSINVARQKCRSFLNNGVALIKRSPVDYLMVKFIVKCQNGTMLQPQPVVDV